jgi:hypothetical protein
MTTNIFRLWYYSLGSHFVPPSGHLTSKIELPISLLTQPPPLVGKMLHFYIKNVSFLILMKGKTFQKQAKINKHLLKMSCWEFPMFFL